MSAMGVSRTVVREAVAALRAEGLVVTRQGVGAFVAAGCSGARSASTPTGLRSIAEVLNVDGAAHGRRDRVGGARGRARLGRRQLRASATRSRHRRAIARDESAIDEDFALPSRDRRGDRQSAIRALPRISRPLHHSAPEHPRRSRPAPPSAARLSRRRSRTSIARSATAIRDRDPAAARDAMRRHLANEPRALSEARRRRSGMSAKTAGRASGKIRRNWGAE